MVISELQSTWKNYLLSEIEEYRIREDGIALWALGGAGFVLKTKGATLYIDPYFGPSVAKQTTRMIPVPMDPNDIRQVDAVVMTHEHADHCDKDTLIPLNKNTNAVFVAPRRSNDLMLSWNIPKQRTVTVKPGDEIQVHDIRLTALRAHDPNPDVDAVTYHFQVGNIGLFHSGDSDYFDGFREVGGRYAVDIALLNLGRTPPNWGSKQYMNYCEVVRAACDLKSKVVVPMHWDIWKEAMEDPFLLKPIMFSQNPKIEVVILRVGDRFEYPIPS